MKKIILLFILLSIIPFLLTGCYDAVSLEKFYYVIALSIDKSNKSNLKLSLQIAKSNSSNESSSQSTQNQIISVDCENIDTGINIINNYLSKKLNFSHCSAIIFSEEMAKLGIKKYVNELINNPEIRPDSHVLICNKNGSDILENVSKSGEKYSSRYYEFVINTVESSGYASQSEFEKFFYDINNSYSSPTADYVTVENDIVQTVGIAVFKSDVFYFYLNPYESLAHLIVNNRLKESIVTISNPYDNSSQICISIKKNKKTSNTIQLINNTPIINTKISLTGKITNMPELSEKDNLIELETELNKYIQTMIENYYYTIIKKYNSDLINFYEKMSTKFLTIQSYNKINIAELYQKSLYKISVDSKITTGLFINK